MPRITALIPSKRNAARLIIHVDGRPVATLSRKQIEALAIELDGDWDESIAARVGDAVIYETAFDKAMKMINRRLLSQAQIKQKLASGGFDEAMVHRVIEKLCAIGAIDDAALAREFVDEIDRTRPAGPALKRAKLLHRGVDENLVEEILDQTQDGASQIAAARKLIASRAKSMQRFDEATRRRKLWGLLARRGFDEDTITAVLGEMHED